MYVIENALAEYKISWILHKANKLYPAEFSNFNFETKMAWVKSLRIVDEQLYKYGKILFETFKILMV